MKHLRMFLLVVFGGMLMYDVGHCDVLRCTIDTLLIVTNAYTLNSSIRGYSE